MKYLPDTNVWSRYTRNRAEDLPLRRRVGAHLSQCLFSTIVLAELEYGAEKRPEVPAFRRRIQDLRMLFPVVFSFDAKSAVKAGWIRAFLANLKPNALPIGPHDVLLAGQALSVGAVFVTANTTEFLRVPGLQVENWQE
ncbi:MAG: PIN domain-containing protein [Puniceicoccales bacterium]|jgi:tRNA(fMet)-specific endonuclease VapC|nr:PIN domain-containing protein [Puniceicoccales bacterium]